MEKQKFVEMMQHAIDMSYFKYGNARKTYPELAQAHKCIDERLDYYEHGRPSRGVTPHNKDYLVDVANFAMLESMFPDTTLPWAKEKKATKSKADATSGWKADFSSEFVNKVLSENSQFDTLDWMQDMESALVSLGQDADLDKNKRLDLIRKALWLWRNQGQRQWLQVILYLAWEEFDAPVFEDSFYDMNNADSNKSPGLAGGISYKELMDGNWRN